MSKIFLENIEKYFKKDTRNRKIIFEYENKIILSNAYSIIILFKNNLKIRDDKKINDLVKKYNIKKYDDLDYLIRYGNVSTILNYYKMLEDVDFIDKIEINNKIKCFFLNKKQDISYFIDASFLNSINKIINNKSGIIFNNIDNDFINVNGNSGYAYILKCKNYKD